MTEVEANLRLNLDADQIRTLVAESIMSRLDDAVRADLIEQAIKAILTPVKTGYGSRQEMKSPLEEAFHNAVQSLTYRIAHEYIEQHPDVQERLRSVIVGGIDKMLADNERLRAQTGEWLSAEILRAFKEA